MPTCQVSTIAGELEGLALKVVSTKRVQLNDRQPHRTDAIRQPLPGSLKSRDRPSVPVRARTLRGSSSRHQWVTPEIDKGTAGRSERNDAEREGTAPGCYNRSG